LTARKVAVAFLGHAQKLPWAWPISDG